MQCASRLMVINRYCHVLCRLSVVSLPRCNRLWTKQPHSAAMIGPMSKGSKVVTSTEEREAFTPQTEANDSNGEANKDHVQEGLVLRLQASAERSPRVRWSPETVDNEHLGRKKSNRTLYHPYYFLSHEP